MMMMMLRRKGQENRIGRRLMGLIIAFSSVLALVATAYQLYHEYRTQRADMDGQLAAVEVFLPPIAASVWSFDDRQIALALDALTRLSHVEYAEVATADGRNRWKSGAIRSERLVTRRYDLTHDARGETRAIATLELTAGLDGIYRRLLDQAIAILASNALKTFLVAAFMYVIFSRVVTRRVEELARNAGSLMPESLVSQVSLFDVPGLSRQRRRDRPAALVVRQHRPPAQPGGGGPARPSPPAAARGPGTDQGRARSSGRGR